jgi:hypothetical protein
MKRRKTVIGGCRTREQTQSVGRSQGEMIQVRRKWLGKAVSFDLGCGQGVQYGKVTSISDQGDVFVECSGGPGQQARALALSVGYLDRMLTLVGD